MAHIAGAGKHTTIIRAAVPVVKRAERLPEVRKVILGVISRFGSGRPRRLKFTEIDIGWKVTVRGGDGAQELFVSTSNRERTKDALEDAFK